MKGVLLLKNFYDPPAVYPPLTVFVVSGFVGANDAAANAGRASLVANSALEISPQLVRDWAGEGANVAVHMPLEGEELQKAIANLGGATRRLAEGVVRHASRLKEGRVRFRDFFIPSPAIHSILGEIDERPFLGPLLSFQLQRKIRGGWLSKTPQTAWSRIERQSDSGEEGYLAYATVYPPNDEHWKESVTIDGRKPQVVGAGPTYSCITSWITALAEEGVRIVPVVAVTEDAEAWKNAYRIIDATQNIWGALEPLGLINIDVPERRGDGAMNSKVPHLWWTTGLSTSSLVQI